MSELSKRWAVAVVAIPAVLGIVYLGGWFLAVPVAAFAGWGAHEVYRFAAQKDIVALDLLGCAAAAGFVLLASWQGDFRAFAPWGMAMIFSMTVAVLLLAMMRRGPDGHPLTTASVTMLGAIYVGLLAFIPLLQGLGASNALGGSPDPLAGLLLLLLPLACTWIGDASAFFAGTAWGRAKMAPSISPNKSWVGFWANIVGAAVGAGGWALLALPLIPSYAGTQVALITVIGAVIGLAAVMGDLVESLLKREAGVKDSGAFFPGHGGVLDRLDSLLFTVPTAYVAFQLLSALS